MNANSSFNPIKPRRDAVLRRIAVIGRYIVESDPDGLTIDLQSGCEPSFAPDQYVVSLHRHGRVFSERPSVQDVLGWAGENSKALGEIGHFFGYWADREAHTFHLDVSIAVRGLAQALRFARETGEYSIYHPATGQVIPVEERQAA